MCETLHQSRHGESRGGGRCKYSLRRSAISSCSGRRSAYDENVKESCHTLGDDAFPELQTSHLGAGRQQFGSFEIIQVDLMSFHPPVVTHDEFYYTGSRTKISRRHNYTLCEGYSPADVENVV